MQQVQYIDKNDNVRSLIEALGFDVDNLDSLVYISESADGKEYRLDLHLHTIQALVSVIVSHQMYKKYVPT